MADRKLHTCGCAGPCARKVTRKPAAGPIERETVKSIAAARQDGRITTMDGGAVMTLLWLAGKMDRDEDTNPRLTANAYVAAAAQLGLTVLGRERIAQATGLHRAEPTPTKDSRDDDGGPAADASAAAFDELEQRRRGGRAG